MKKQSNRWSLFQENIKLGLLLLVNSRQSRHWKKSGALQVAQSDTHASIPKSKWDTQEILC